MNNSTTSQPSFRKTFAEAYCSQHQIPLEKFAQSVLKESLHPMARVLYPLIRVLSSNYFQADLDLVRATGRLRRTRDYAMEVSEFVHHPANSGFLRASLDLRISTGRLRQLLRRTLRAEPPSSDEESSREEQEKDPNKTALPFAIAKTQPDSVQKKYHA
ncbi:hypothetical protein [Geminisphaera colitermitum]|uniref:hypothetical protein n=1 Tax=Geminisphaera colitermitum TaxID=1148786 RepID=UPI000158C6A1|nr:hypothetical protein [Geminisphaera colitermitum]